MPNKLRKELNDKKEVALSLCEMSRHLRNFEEKGLIKCINREYSYNKIYAITSKRINTLQKLKKIEK